MQIGLDLTEDFCVKLTDVHTPVVCGTDRISGAGLPVINSVL